MNQNLLTFPIFIAIIYWIIGISGNWKRNSYFIILNLLSFIISFQYNKELVKSDLFDSFLTKSTRQNEAITFIISFVLICVGIYLLYRILWKHSSKQNSTEDNKQYLFLQSIVLALVGWGIGVILSICIISFNNLVINLSTLPKTGLFPVLRTTASFMINIGKPFSANGIPQFLQSWIIY